MMNFSSHVRLLPLLVLVALLSLVVRIGEVATGVQRGVAFAQHEVNAQPPALPVDQQQEEENNEAAEMANTVADAPSADERGPDVDASLNLEGEKVEWKDATEAEFDYSEIRSGLYKDLASRREELERRERSLATREALLEAAGRELDQKLREMTAVRNEIEGLLQQQSEVEEARVSSLVRIYESMKSQDAARIFDTLDTDVLLSVLSRMSERKSAPILADMNPERARTVTILLAQQKQIPAIPPQ